MWWLPLAWAGPVAVSVPERLVRAAADDPAALPALVEAVVGDATDPADKARRIHDFIALNVDYDMESFLAGAHPAWDPASTLGNGRAVCEGYARLFEAMAGLAGLEARTVHGYGRGIGFDPFTEVVKENHAWNQVKIDDAWLPVDVTWDAGGVLPDGAWRRGYSDTLFLADPVLFLHTHFPTDPADQLVDPPLDGAALLRQPAVESPLIHAPPELEERTSAGSMATFTLGIDRGARVFADVFDSAGHEVPHHALVDGDGATARVRVAFPAAGDWEVVVYVAPPSPEPTTRRARRAAPVVGWSSLRLGFTASDAAGGVLPFEFGGWKSGYELLSDPLWVPGTPTTIALRLPGVNEAVAWSGDERWPLRRDGEVFTGEIPQRVSFNLAADGVGILGWDDGSE